MKKKIGLKSILASILVTASLVVPSVVLSVTGTDPVAAELIFRGAELRYCDDGSIQAIFDVAIDQVINSNGTSFHLNYNGEYLTPSYFSDVTDEHGTVIHKANEAIVLKGGAENRGEFFQENYDLYGKTENGEPIPILFRERKVGNYVLESFSQLDTTSQTIIMKLRPDQDRLPAIVEKHGLGGELGMVEHVGESDATRFAFNVRAEGDATPAKEIVLGQLSFRIERDRLPEVVDLFDGMDVLRRRREDNAPGGNPNIPYVNINSISGATQQTFLLDVDKTLKAGEDPYQLDCFYGDDAAMMADHYYRIDATDQPMPDADNVGDHYIFNFNKKMIIDVEATNPEVTVNAYQNFSEGEETDLPITMGRYCPTVTVTYADGSKENVPFPWGGRAGAVDGLGNPDRDNYTVTSGLVGADYDPTHGEYTFSQSYKYQVQVMNPDGTPKEDALGNPVYRTEVFPKPVTAKLTVTPITVIDVTAEDLGRTYPLDEVLELVPNAGALRLPAEARIITDIVPAGVSLVTRIKGWTPVQPSTLGDGDAPVSAWPTPSTDLSSLKADTYNKTAGTPYWPDGDNAGTTLAPGDHVGDYFFQTAKEDHATAEGILSQDIRDAYQWLTVPDQSGKTESGKDEWMLENARRSIVARADFLDPENYVVKYVSTVTQTAAGNGNGQPTLTLSVEHADQKTNMGADAIFRIWLPNGMEIGTGQYGGGVDVTEWFGGKTYADHDHGHYHTETAYSVTATSMTNAHLITNPGDPKNPTAHEGERETLRRYINLGGWYRVAVCEFPDPGDPGKAAAWTDPIPVYVPPRPNEYQESKTYNFIGENAALANWPGPVGDTLYLPRGNYTPVGPVDTTGATAGGVGLPLYRVTNDVTGDVVITDGQANPGAGVDPADIFEDGNLHRLKDGVTRYEESYGVKTTYDGQTGAQPGEIYNVRVNAADTTHTDPWSKRGDGTTHTAVGADPVYRYGPAPLYHQHRVNAYGDILNVETAAGNGDFTTYKGTLRTQLTNPEPSLREEIRLVSDSPTGITRVVQNDYESNVTLVTYDTKMEGYTVRQDYILTIKNVGDVDIYGLDIDGLTDGYVQDPEGGRFEMLVPPASFLPKGSSTTFVLTYVYDLKNNERPDTPLKYRDTLYITSTSHNAVNHPGTHDMDDYLLEFDAEFAVSESPLHKVTVIYKPENGTMGTAGLIVGEQGTAAAPTMNYTTTTRTYAEKDRVYVVVNKVDEYEVHSITMSDAAGNAIKDANGKDIVLYPGQATLKDGTEVYVFDMPDQDVVVTVNFYEPIWSKLRLSDLIEFSAPKGDPDEIADADLVHAGYDPRQDSTDAGTRAKAYTPNDQGHIYPLWQKQFVGTAKVGEKDKPGYKAPTGDYKDAEDWSLSHGNAASNYYLMTEGSAIPRADGGNQYNSSKSHYLVVIDAEDDLSQIKATLRKVQFHEDWQGKAPVGAADYDLHKDGYNDDIKPVVNMTVYYEDQVRDNWNNANVPLAVYDGGHGYGPYSLTDLETSGVPRNQRPQGDTALETQHVSQEFNSPKEGESAYVHITVTLGDDTRDYYVEIHRKTKNPDVKLHYGNSPYGMIMNEDTKGWSAAAKEEAKEAFRKGYTFAGVAANNLPSAVANKLDKVTYWREAWVRNEGLFEPESMTNINDYREYPDNDNGYEAIYANERNLDLNDEAFFAVLGQDMREPGVVYAYDSSGRSVPLHKITACMVGEADNTGVTLLDTAQTQEVARFSGTETQVIDLGVAGRTLTYKKTGDTPDPADPQLGAKNWPLVSTSTTTSPTDGSAPVTTKTYTAVSDLRPGQYLIRYSFTDFDGDSILSVTRPLVILREVGDVNADGTRNAGSHTDGTDEYAIEDRVTHDPLGYEAGKWDSTNGETVYPHANIFKFRVCDVNNDRNINNIDANQVAENVKAAGGWLQFYDSLHYGLTAPEVTAPPAAP